MPSEANASAQSVAMARLGAWVRRGMVRQSIRVVQGGAVGRWSGRAVAERQGFKRRGARGLNRQGDWARSVRFWGQITRDVAPTALETPQARAFDPKARSPDRSPCLNSVARDGYRRNTSVGPRLICARSHQFKGKLQRQIASSSPEVWAAERSAPCPPPCGLLLYLRRTPCHPDSRMSWFPAQRQTSSRRGDWVR